MTSPSSAIASFMNTTQEMNVLKRDGNIETVSFDKILKRIKTVGAEAGIHINYTSLVIKVIDQLYDLIPSTKIDELLSEQCIAMSSIHPDYNILASRIAISNHHKNTSASFSESMNKLYSFIDKHGKNVPLISKELFTFVSENADELDALCDYTRDFLIDYFGFKTLERSYLMRVKRVVVERPQHMWLRVSIGIHGTDMAAVRETYEYMSLKYFTHATPTLFNAGTPRPQLSSCYLLAMEEDSIEGIFNTLKDCAQISKWAGGIGLHIHNVRATGSHIQGTNGTSNGIVPMLRVFNNTAKYVDQCVIPETIIYTTDGPKEIQHCVSGETAIFNLTGQTEIIKNVLEYDYQGELLEIEIQPSYQPEFETALQEGDCSKLSVELPVENANSVSFELFNRLKITPEHPIYVSKDNSAEQFEWIDAKDLNENDMVVYTIPEYEKDISTISSDDCYLYGILLYQRARSDENISNKIILYKRRIDTAPPRGARSKLSVELPVENSIPDSSGFIANSYFSFKSILLFAKLVNEFGFLNQLLLSIIFIKSLSIKSFKFSLSIFFSLSFNVSFALFFSSSNSCVIGFTTPGSPKFPMSFF